MPAYRKDLSMWQPKQIMMNGELMPIEDASLHPMSLAVTYATTVFEGLRAYHMPESGQFALFRLADHLQRLRIGMKIMRFDESYEDSYCTYQWIDIAPEIYFLTKLPTQVTSTTIIAVTTFGALATSWASARAAKRVANLPVLQALGRGYL